MLPKTYISFVFSPEILSGVNSLVYMVLFEAFFKESPQGKVSDSVFVTLSKKRCGADNVFGMVVANLLQWAEFPVSRHLFCHYIACLHINCFSWLGAYEIYFSRIQYANLPYSGIHNISIVLPCNYFHNRYL